MNAISSILSLLLLLFLFIFIFALLGMQVSRNIIMLFLLFLFFFYSRHLRRNFNVNIKTSAKNVTKVAIQEKLKNHVGNLQVQGSLLALAKSKEGGSLVEINAVSSEIWHIEVHVKWFHKHPAQPCKPQEMEIHIINFIVNSVDKTKIWSYCLHLTRKWNSFSISKVLTPAGTLSLEQFGCLQYLSRASILTLW